VGRAGRSKAPPKAEAGDSLPLHDTANAPLAPDHDMPRLPGDVRHDDPSQDRVRDPQGQDIQTRDAHAREGDGGASPQADKPGGRSPLWKRLAKSAIGLALLVAFGWGPLQTMLQVASVEALVNARLVTIRAPIDGQVVIAPTEMTTWSPFDKGAPVLRIVNLRADRARLDDLRRQIGRLEDERAALTQRADQARGLLDSLRAQTQVFAEGRARQLEARIAALRNDVASAAAQAEEAVAASDRANALLRTGASTRAEVQRRERDKTTTAESHAAARNRLAESEVELAAVRRGTFVGDSYNDRPSSVQRSDEARQRLGDLEAELSLNTAQLARLRQELADEGRRYADMSDVQVALPLHGRIWELMTATGEEVRRGQDLLRVLDCASPVVTANVSETVYNGLQLGTRAHFRPTGGGEDYEGAVVGLTGMATAPANYAIQPGALVREAYRVTVAVPRLAETSQCPIGRTGRVRFDTSATPQATGSLPSTQRPQTTQGLRP
jgi:multidrug resistance efflux pump